MSFLARRFGVLTWRHSARAARRLHEFALAEHGSMIDLRLAANLVTSPERAALYLRHAADEERHARMFSKHAAEWHARASMPQPPPPRADTEALFQRLGEVGFLAFVHRGERRGRRQFEAYRDHFARRGEDKTAQLFASIIEDERRHETYTLELLEELAGSKRAARKALRRAALWEAWRTYRRAGRSLANATYFVCVSVIYLCAAPLSLLLRVLRPTRAGLLPPER